jgi:hypothetical protein
MALTVVALVVLSFVSGCFAPLGGCGANSNPSEVSCAIDSDCPSGSSCLYFVADSCSATGMCQANPTPGDACAAAEVTACGCDGTTMTWPGGCDGVPEGEAPGPIAHLGPCGG